MGDATEVELIRRVESDLQRQLMEHTSSGHQYDEPPYVQECRDLAAEIRALVAELRAEAERAHDAAEVAVVAAEVAEAEADAVVEATEDTVEETVEETVPEAVADELPEALVAHEEQEQDAAPRRTSFLDRKIGGR